MKIDYDPVKNAKNIAERGLPFDQVGRVEWVTALIREDERKDYPEQRFIMLACLEGRLHVACFTPIDGGIRVISFRKANQREIKAYEQQHDPC